MAVLPVVSTVISALSCVLCIVGMALPYWVYIEQGEVSRHDGLFKACANGTCFKFNNLPSSLEAVRSLEILGVVLLAFGVLAALIKLIALKEKTALLKLAGVCAFLGGGAVIAGCSIYATIVKDDYYPGLDLHFAFLLCVIAGVGSFLSGVLFCLNRGN